MRSLFKALLPITSGLLTLSLACSSNDGGTPATPPVITAQPANQIAGSGASASFMVAASGNPSPTFTWERSNAGDGTWAAISGATSATYTFTVAKGDDQAQFRVLAANTVGTATSDSATLTAQWLEVTSQPAGQPVVSPSTATFTITVDAKPAATYQWQSSADGVSWGDLPGATDSSYTTGPTAVSSSGTKFRCLATNSARTLASDPATLTVNQPHTGPAITTQPANQTTNVGSQASFLAAASGNPSPTFTWERSNDGASTWTVINGATSATYTFTTASTDNTSQFRARATSSVGAATSDPATLTLQSVYVAGCSVNSSNVEVPGYWKDGTWVGLTPLDSAKNSYVKALVISGSDVYASGNSSNSSNVMVAGYWKNGTWVGLPPLAAGKHAWAYRLAVSGSDVYVGGSCGRAADSTYAPGYWKNGTWVGLPPLQLAGNSGVYALSLSGGDVYAAGSSQQDPKMLPGY